MPQYSMRTILILTLWLKQNKCKLCKQVIQLIEVTISIKAVRKSCFDGEKHLKSAQGIPIFHKRGKETD